MGLCYGASKRDKNKKENRRSKQKNEYFEQKSLLRLSLQQIRVQEALRKTTRREKITGKRTTAQFREHKGEQKREAQSKRSLNANQGRIDRK